MEFKDNVSNSLFFFKFRGKRETKDSYSRDIILNKVRKSLKTNSISVCVYLFPPLRIPSTGTGDGAQDACCKRRARCEESVVGEAYGIL